MAAWLSSRGNYLGQVGASVASRAGRESVATSRAQRKPLSELGAEVIESLRVRIGFRLQCLRDRSSAPASSEVVSDGLQAKPLEVFPLPVQMVLTSPLFLSRAQLPCRHGQQVLRLWLISVREDDAAVAPRV